MPGIIRQASDDEISVGNDAGTENSLNLLVNTKATSAQNKTINIGALRDWYRKYTAMPGTANDSTETEMSFGGFGGSCIFGVRLTVYSETGTGGWNYDNNGNGKVDFTHLYGGKARAGSYSVAFAGGGGVPGEKAEYFNYNAGQVEPLAQDGDAGYMPAEERIHLEAAVAGSAGNQIVLEGSDSIRPSFSGVSYTPRNVSLTGPTPTETEDTDEIRLIQSAGQELTIAELVSDQQLDGVVTINNGGDVIPRSGAEITIPIALAGGDAATFDSDNVPARIEFTLSISDDDPYGNDDIKLQGNGTDTIEQLIADNFSTRVWNYGDAALGVKDIVLFSGEEIVVGGGSTDTTLQSLVDTWNSKAGNPQVVIRSSNTGIAPSSDQTMQLAGGQDASGGGVWTGTGTRSVGSLGSTSKYSSLVTYEFTVSDVFAGVSFDLYVDMGTTTGTGNTRVYSDSSDINSYNTNGTATIFDVANTRTGNATATLLCRGNAQGIGPILEIV